MAATSTTSVSFEKRLVTLGRDIKLSHSVFALPFAILGGYLAAASEGFLLHEDTVSLGLILLCMFFARTVAMTVNRLADRKIDQVNPRTQGRALPSGQLNARFVLGTTLVCALGLIGAASGFWWLNANPWPVLLSPLVLVWLGLYSFMKRVSWGCHLFLGSALAISPLAAGLAIEPHYLETPTLWLLGVMVLGWVGGFDVIYALQDIDSDQAHGVHSIPARFGVKRALWISRALHLLCFGALVGVWRSSDMLGVGFGIGMVIVAVLLIVEHRLIRDPKTGNINMAFFTVNGIISLLLGGLGVLDVILTHST